MAAFTIAQILKQEPWTHQQHGQFIAYKVQFEDGAVAELNQKPETKELSVGQVLNGNIDGKKFVKEKPAYNSSDGGGKSSGPSEAYWASQNRAKGRAASHKTMVEVYRLGREEGVFEPAAEAKEFYARLTSIAEWLDRDVARAADWPESANG